MLKILMMEYGMVLYFIYVNQTEGCLCYCQVSNLVQGTEQEVCMYVYKHVRMYVASYVRKLQSIQCTHLNK